MTQQHTPGPWKILYAENYTRIVKPNDHTDDFIAAVGHPNDAPILAAAPELLEALQVAVWELPDRCEHERAMAHAAIAKATGGRT